MQHIHAHDSRAPGAQSPRTAAQPAHFPDTIDGELLEGAPYSGTRLAEDLAIAESTFRIRWLPWLLKVAPVELLKTDAGYTELARTLAQEFKSVPKKKASREQWVAAAKERYSQEFMPSGLVGEGVPDELGGALALLRSQGSEIQTAADAQLLSLQTLIEQQAQVEAEFDEAEVAAMRAAGAKRGVMRFQIETTEEDAAYYQLRKMRTQARSGSGSQPGKS